MTDARFSTDSPGSRLSVALEGFALVFHRPSGITHILVPPAPEMLDALDQGAAGAREIVERLAESHQVDDREEAEAIVTARLAELEAGGLIERR